MNPVNYVEYFADRYFAVKQMELFSDEEMEAIFSTKTHDSICNKVKAAIRRIDDPWEQSQVD